MQGEFVLPKVLQVYREDFGNSEEKILNFIYKYLVSPEIDEETAIREVCHKKSMMIRYEWLNIIFVFNI